MMNKIFLPFILVIQTFNGFGQTKIPTDELLINTTIKIETIEKRIDSGKTKYSKSSGTGFFFSFSTSDGKSVPVIVTNKHVVRNALKGILYFKPSDSAGGVIYGHSEKIIIDSFSSWWLMHPDTSVDLAICPLMPIVNRFKKDKGKQLFFTTIPESLIPSDSSKRRLTAIEEVMMIGYPWGIRDSINDIPIVRRGISATPIFLDYNSKKEFLIDMPVFYGSSGSPILIYNQGSWSDRSSSIMSSMKRIFLVGINYATYTKNFDGKIIPKTSENLEESYQTQTNLPLTNIGIIIKAERLLDFKALLKLK